MLHVDSAEDEVYVYAFSDRDVKRVTQIKTITDENLIVMLAGKFISFMCVCVYARSSFTLMKKYV